MKNLTIALIALLLLASCGKEENQGLPADKWNGYSRYLKSGDVVHTLWAGKNINIGTVTYGLDDSANFYVTYDCRLSGWTISETHMFAGDKKDMPLNRPGQPKIGLFPNSAYHDPVVNNFTVRLPLSSLPPAEEPGFVVAAHCVAHSPSGRTETAWAEGDFTFTDKSWGWYDSFFYNQVENQFTILYGTSYTTDSLKIYHLNMTTSAVTLVLEEYVGNISGIYDGTAYDVDSGLLFFVNYNTGQLYINRMNDTLPSFCSGTLNGLASGGTFHDGAFYYVDSGNNSINKITFTDEWQIAGESIVDFIPSYINVNDIAMSPAGDYLYISGEVSGGGTELIKWSVADDIYYSVSYGLEEGTQIAFGNDGNLYALSPSGDGAGILSSYIIEVETGILTELDEGEIIMLDEPFSDISSGPLM